MSSIKRLGERVRVHPDSSLNKERLFILRMNDGGFEMVSLATLEVARLTISRYTLPAPSCASCFS